MKERRGYLKRVENDWLSVFGLPHNRG